MLFALRTTLGSQILHNLSCRFGRINNRHVWGSQTPQQRFDQGIMSATQNENVSRLESIGKGLAQVNAGDLFGNRVLNPTFLDQRHEQRASLLPGLYPEILARLQIS